MTGMTPVYPDLRDKRSDVLAARADAGYRAGAADTRRAGRA